MALSTQVVHQRLTESAQRVRLSRSVRYMMSGVAVSLLVLMVCLLLDCWLHFGALGRWAGFLTVVAPLAAGAAYTAMAWKFRLSEAGVARRIEDACAGANNVLISAVQFDRQLAADSPLRRALFEEMHDPFPRVRWMDVFDSKLIQKLGMGLLGAALAVAFWAAISPRYFVNSAARIFLPASDIAPLTRTQILDIKPGDARVVHGAGVEVSAKLGGEVPGAAWLFFRELGSSWQKKAMNREPDMPVFTFQWKDVRQPMEYYIDAGDAVSTSHRVLVRPRTAVSSRVAEITPPAYTRLPKETVRDFTQLQNILPGSRVAVTLEFNYPLQELKASGDGEQPMAVERTSDTRWLVADTVMANRAVKLAFRDKDQFSDHEQLSITVKADEAPKITVSDPPEGRELLAPRDAVLKVKFTATDNFGLGALALYKSTSESQMGLLVQDWKDIAGKLEFNGAAEIPLRKFAAAEEERVAFVIAAKDQNTVTGPGVTLSRPLVVTLKAAGKAQQEAEDASGKLQKGLEDLVKLQKTNLDETRGAARMKPATPETVTPLFDRQAQVLNLARALADAAELVSQKVRGELVSLANNEMKEAVLTMRNAVSAPEAGRPQFLGRGVQLMSIILARLEGAPDAVQMDADKGKIADLVSGLEELRKKQLDLWRQTKAGAVGAAKELSDKQDALAQQAVKVRKTLEGSSGAAALADKEMDALLGGIEKDSQKPKERQIFDDRAREAARAAINASKAVAAEKKITPKLTDIIGKMFVSLKIYEEMLGAADKLGSQALPDAAVIQAHVIRNLSCLIELLNGWMISNAGKKADELRDNLAKLRAKLDKLDTIQRDIVEKSKELARKKDEFNPDDKATAREVKESKDLMKDVLEQMTTDLQAFPDIRPSNDLKMEIMTVYEDVIQADKEEAEAGTLKAQDVPVQKEESLLEAIEKAKEVAADTEMWLPNKNDTAKFQQENFDLTEMPEIPNLPIAEQMEDLVGNLLEQQKGLDATDAASNQALATATQGWEVADGQMPGFSAQGKSGNRPPEHNEQMGRSSGGREGMSDGEMVGAVAKNLQGDTPDVRRTKDQFQQGSVKDEDGPSATRATGGGKAGAFSDRLGMDGQGPLRDSVAQRRLAVDAAAVAQELLKQKTTKIHAQATLFYLRADGLKEVARLQDQAAQALREGRLKDFEGLRQKIVRQLQDVKTQLAGGQVVSLAGGDARAADRQVLGGTEGEAPAQYKDMVADYYRALAEGK